MSDQPFRLAIATCAERPDLIDSERYLLQALPEKGIEAQPVIWNDPAVTWSDYDGVLIRTIWDYHQHYDAYLRWIDLLKTQGLLAGNSLDLLRWNSHKFYLEELQENGISIPPTQFLRQGTDISGLKPLWNDFIIKPAVSATAFQTYKLDRDTFEQHRSEISQLLEQKDLLIQQFIPSIASAGEWSLVFFGENYSHAVIKRAKAGEFRVQAEFGGSYDIANPDEQLIDFGRRVMSVLKSTPLYARVDLVVDENQPLLMELELVEPELFLLMPEITERFLEEIVRYFQRSVAG